MFTRRSLAVDDTDETRGKLEVTFRLPRQLKLKSIVSTNRFIELRTNTADRAKDSAQVEIVEDTMMKLDREGEKRCVRHRYALFVRGSSTI